MERFIEEIIQFNAAVSAHIDGKYSTGRRPASEARRDAALEVLTTYMDWVKESLLRADSNGDHEDNIEILERNHAALIGAIRGNWLPTRRLLLDSTSFDQRILKDEASRVQRVEALASINRTTNLAESLDA